MYKQGKAIELLSRAEISIAGAEEALDVKGMEALKGELLAVNEILSRIRKESVDGFQE